MSISDGWFYKAVEIRRYESTVADFTETGGFETLYEELNTSVHGEASGVENTIVGDFGVGASQLIWRVGDIDSEKGWPQEKDVVILDGRQYFINRIVDHTNIPPMFTAIHPHKVAFIGENLLEV